MTTDPNSLSAFDWLVASEQAKPAWEGVQHADVKVGDRILFLTADNGYSGNGYPREREGLVVAVTDKTVRVTCGHETAVLRRDSWYPRSVRRILPTEQS